MVSMPVGVALCVLLFVCRGEAALRLEPWQPIFQGVSFARGEAGPPEHGVQRVCAVRVDLRAEGVEFFSTPDNGPLPRETTSETTQEFLVRHKLQVAINANFYSPCCEPGDKDLTGFALSRGIVVSPPLASGRSAAVLAITRNNEVALLPKIAVSEASRFWTGVAGSDLILVGGRPARLADSPLVIQRHPRTAVGLSEDGRWLFLLAIDGRQPNYSQGATLRETAEWLLHLGAHGGINLDGGGSTTLVREQEGRPIVLNRVSGAAKPRGDGSEERVTERRLRSVGNNLGLRARPLERSPAVPARAQ